jgi:8-oxo-dGTP pyrophosphatase MutT (NUDIX family)
VQRRVRVAFFRPFRRLPLGLRRFLVRRVAPCYTTGAVVCIERADGAVLLVSQSYRRNWGLPGGLLQRGEEPAEAVVREVGEEIGVEVALDGEPAVVFDALARRIDFVYRGRLADTCAQPWARSAELLDVQWFTPGALPRVHPETVAGLAALNRLAPPAAR